MERKNRSIFRAESVRRYISDREKSVLPRFISPRTFTYLWLIAGLLVVMLSLAGFIAWNFILERVN